MYDSGMGVKKEEIIPGAAVTAGLLSASATVATLTGDPRATIAAALGNMLQVAIGVFADMSQKRTGELFDDPQLVDKITCRIKESEDFASFIFDLWRRYNFESSEERRLMLKTFLKNATLERERDYENFSKIFLVMQQITRTELLVLKAFNSRDVYDYSETPSQSARAALNAQEAHKLITEKRIATVELSEVEEALMQLGNYGLVHEKPATIGGPYYSQRMFGAVFLDYLES